VAQSESQTTGGVQLSAQSAAESSNSAAETIAAADVLSETEQLTTELTADVEQASENAAETEPSNDEKPNSLDRDAKPIVSANDGDPTENKRSIVDARVSEISNGMSPVANQVPADNASSKPAGAASTSDADGATSDDDRRGSRSESRVSGREAASPTAKADAALIANVSATANDPAENAHATGDKNDQATKPIAAKSEAVSASLARLTRASTGANGNHRAANADEPPRVDPARFVGRVAKAFQTAQDRGGILQLRLSPPELGSLRLELAVKDGVMSAALQTENANARRLLLDHLPALRDRLAEQNIRVDRFDVDVRREGTGGQADTRGSHQQHFQHQPQEPAPRRPGPMLPRERATPAPETVPDTLRISDAGLNLIV